MRTHWLILLTLTGSLALAQEPFPGPGPEDLPEMGPPGLENAQEFPGEPVLPPRRGHPGLRREGAEPPFVNGPFVQRLMERLQHSDPNEYQRLQQLQQENPEAFRDELLSRLKRERLERLRQDFPQIAAALENLGQRERDWLLNRLQEGEPGPGPGGGRGLRQAFSPEMQQAEQKTLRLAEAYRQATAAEEQDRLRGELQASLATSFDLREKARTEEIRLIEERLGKLRESVATRREHRDEIIQRRLRELTDGDALKW